MTQLQGAVIDSRESAQLQFHPTCRRTGADYLDLGPSAEGDRAHHFAVGDMVGVITAELEGGAIERQADGIAPSASSAQSTRRKVASRTRPRESSFVREADSRAWIGIDDVPVAAARRDHGAGCAFDTELTENIDGPCAQGAVEVRRRSVGAALQGKHGGS